MVLTSYDLGGPDPRPMSHGEIDTLKMLCRDLPPNPVIVQIGAERGCSTLAILEERPDAFIFSIDVGERPEETQNVKDGHQDHRRVVRGLGRSQNIGKFWPETWTADLVFIDGDHRYEGVLNDILEWTRVVRNNGYLVLHDFIHPDHRAPSIVGRVYEAVMESGLFENFRTCVEYQRLIAFRVFWMEE
jgi:predicted O-methyltransferase YrrM